MHVAVLKVSMEEVRRLFGVQSEGEDHHVG